MPAPTPQEYIASFPSDIQQRLHAIRNSLLVLVPAASEAMKYGIPTLVYHENLVHYAAFKHHIGFYPSPSGIEAFAAELAAYKTSKGAIQFPHSEELPLELIERITRFRVQQVEAKHNAL